MPRSPSVRKVACRSPVVFLPGLSGSPTRLRLRAPSPSTAINGRWRPILIMSGIHRHPCDSTRSENDHRAEILRRLRLRAERPQFDGQNPPGLQAKGRRDEADPRVRRLLRVQDRRRVDPFEARDRSISGRVGLDRKGAFAHSRQGMIETPPDPPGELMESIWTAQRSNGRSGSPTTPRAPVEPVSCRPAAWLKF